MTVLQFAAAHWQQAATLGVTLLCTGWAGNALSSVIVQKLGAVKKTGPGWTVVRFVHGILNQIDKDEK